jgi:hypothetical protein
MLCAYDGCCTGGEGRAGVAGMGVDDGGIGVGFLVGGDTGTVGGSVGVTFGRAGCEEAWIALSSAWENSRTDL